MQVENSASMRTIRVARIRRGGTPVYKDDSVADEFVLSITVNGVPAGTLLCSPVALDDLVRGFIISEGIVTHAEAIRSIRIDLPNGRALVDAKTDMELLDSIDGRRTITSGCGASGSEIYRLRDSLRARPLGTHGKQDLQDILCAVREMGNRSVLFHETGGVHSCAVSQGSQIELFADDVGRHNAADKVLGALAARSDLRDTTSHDRLALVTTGRLSSEMVLKTVIHRIPVLASRSAPTRLAIAVAEELHLTLVGFCRGRSCNVYSGEERLDFGRAGSD